MRVGGFIPGDLKIAGDIGTVGGFMIVVGDVITNPSGTYDATISGEGALEKQREFIRLLNEESGSLGLRMIYK